jgi:hypothetical protein
MSIKSAKQSGLGGFNITDTSLKAQGTLAVGGSVLCLNGYNVHTFTGTGTFNALQPLNVEYLIVGGGGSAGSALYHSGGGGGGGIAQGSMYIPAGTYTVTVGAGGANPGSTSLKGNNGNNSCFNGIIAYGGGGAGVYDCVSGRNGGSGGGGGAQSGLVGPSGLGCQGQGYCGGCYDGSASGNKTGGGGGGGYATGQKGTDGSLGGGGNGFPSFIANTLKFFSGGGGGSTECVSLKTIGGIGGGGQGNYNYGQDGTANTGGGGGGGERISPAIGGSGGSGVVYIKYKTNNDFNPTGQIVTDCLIYYADTDNRVSYPGLVNIVGAKIFSTFGNVAGAWRASCYYVQYSSDNSTWNTAFCGIMSNNGNFGVQSGTSNITTPVGPYRYWRYVESCVVCSHHPRVSRVMLTDNNGNDYVICKYTNDNVSDVGEYQIGTITRDFCSIWHDMSGCSNTANLINTPAYSTINGGTLYFNGNNYVPVHCYNQQSSVLSLDVWVTASCIQQKATILSKWGTSVQGNFSWLLFTNWFSDGIIDFLVGDGASNYYTVGIKHCFELGKWSNFSIIYNAGTVNMYKNSQLICVGSIGASTLKSVPTCFTIGADWDTGGASDTLTRTWGGCIASVKAYGKALSQAEITQNFNALRGRFCV